jgi:hypothetical protein
MVAKHRLLLVAIVGFAALLGGSKWELSGAQSPPQATQTYKLWGVYWSVSPGFESTVEMKNNRLDETVTAHISVYFASGEEYYLDSLRLGPRETRNLSLNQALDAAPRGVASRASREGTLEVEFTSENSSAIMGSITVQNRRQGLAWNFFLYPALATAVQPLRGVFWFPDRRADGFVAIQNLSEEVILLEPVFHVSGGQHAVEPIRLPASGGVKFELRRELRRLGMRDVEAGGLELRYQGPPGALQAHGVLFDEEGFSTEVDFLRYGESLERKTFAYRTPRFAVGAADPRLGLPPRTRFQSYLVCTISMGTRRTLTWP